LTWPRKPPAWSSGKNHEYLRPYWDGHMFIAIYLHSRGFTNRRIGAVIGVSFQRVAQMVEKAQRIIRSVDEHGYARERVAALRAAFVREEQH
jgi:hypothetical protein